MWTDTVQVIIMYGSMIAVSDPAYIQIERILVSEFRLII